MNAKRCWHQRILGLALVLLVVLVPATSLGQAGKQGGPAQPTTAQNKVSAQRLKQQGDEAMASLRYAEALELYNQAYAVDPNPALSYNRGRALQALNRFPEALEHFEAFAKDAPPALRARVDKLDELLAEVRAKVAQLKVTCNVDGARVLVAGRLVGTTPLDEPVRLNAGPTLIEAFAEGYEPKRLETDLPGGKDSDVRIELRARSTEAVLVVRSPVAGATVLVDGREVGTAPAEAKLKPGEHRVVVRHDGYDEAATSVVLKPNATKTIDVSLQEQPSVVETWWFWSAIGAAVVAGVVITAVALTERSPDEGDIDPGTVTTPLLGGQTLIRF